MSLDDASITRGSFLKVSGIKRSQFRLVKLDDCEFDWQEAFIIMEFGNNKHDSYYKRAILPVLERLNITPRRVDQYEFHGRITDEILDKIITAKLLLQSVQQPIKMFILRWDMLWEITRMLFCALIMQIKYPLIFRIFRF